MEILINTLLCNLFDLASISFNGYDILRIFPSLPPAPRAAFPVSTGVKPGTNKTKQNNKEAATLWTSKKEIYAVCHSWFQCQIKLSRLFFHIKPEDDWRDAKETFSLAALVRRHSFVQMSWLIILSFFCCHNQISKEKILSKVSTSE